MPGPPLTDALAETLAVFEDQAVGTPLTTTEVAGELASGRRSTYEKLKRLVEGGHLATKAVGAHGRVWWQQPRSHADEPADADTLSVSFQSLVDAVAEYAIFLLSPSGRVASWNRGAERIKGYARREIIGEPLETFYTEDDAAEGLPQRNLEAAAATGSVTDEGWRVRKDGSRFWASVTITALFDGKGELEGYAKVTRDMTEQRDYERRLRRQRDALEAEVNEMFQRVDDAFFALDTAWRFTYVNDRAAEVLGRSVASMLGTVVWDTLPEVADGRPRKRAERAVEEQEPTEFEVHSELLGAWYEVKLFPSETGLSVYFRDVTARKAREHELERYETIVETMDDGVYVVDDAGRFSLVNRAYADLVGHSRETLEGAHVSLVVDRETAATARAFEAELRSGEREVARIEADLQTADGDRVPGEATFTMLTTDGGRSERIGVVRDMTERIRRARVLEQQRAHLAALDHLNAVIRDVTDAVIDQPNREEVERTLCDRLTATNAYDVAWIGDVEPSAGTLRYRVGSDGDGRFDELGGTTELDPSDAGPIGRALASGTMQVTEDMESLDAIDGWHSLAIERDIRSAATIPIRYGENVYGVLSLYTSREEAFTAEEQAVVAGLGEVVGHAIASVDRKQALMSDEVVELEFRLDWSEAGIAVESDSEGRAELNQAIATGDGTFLVYGASDAEGVELVSAIEAANQHWESVTFFGTPDDDGRFQARLTAPPVLATVAELGGRVERVVITGKETSLVVQQSPDANVRRVIDAVRAHYPHANMVARRQVARAGGFGVDRVAMERLTERQRTVLQAAFNSGYFEQPRLSTGAEVAEELGISAAAFHQHVRTANRKLVAAMIVDPVIREVADGGRDGNDVGGRT